jgi:hypothetical protein
MKSIGKLVYSPRSHLGSNDKWAAVLCDDEISRYYRYLYSKEYPYLNSGRSTTLTRPIWGSHISLVRNEPIPNPKLWRLDEGKIIEFEYEGGVLGNSKYYWLKVQCPYLEDLREKMGLSRQPRFGLHLTIGVSSKT